MRLPQSRHDEAAPGLSPLPSPGAANRGRQHMPNKSNCYKCRHRGEVLGDAHSRCKNLSAKVTAHSHGVQSGWFNWPNNFDPRWLHACDGFEAVSVASAPS
jgi:hypothetical protein